MRSRRFVALYCSARVFAGAALQGHVSSCLLHFSFQCSFFLFCFAFGWRRCGGGAVVNEGRGTEAKTFSPVSEERFLPLSLSLLRPPDMAFINEHPRRRRGHFLLWSADVRSLRHRGRGRQGSETRSLRREICSAFTASMLEYVDGSSFTTASEKDKRVDESCSETHRDCSWNCVQDLYRRNTHNFR